jgi:tRNA ligase
LIEAVKSKLPNIRIVAIYWNHEYGSHNEIFQITSKRVIARGENHQSLTPKSPNYEGIMWNFLESFEGLDSNNHVDNQFDHVIELDVINDIKTNLNIVVKELEPIIGIKIPDEDETKKALEEINHYKPTVRKFFGKVVYYGIKLNFNVRDFLTKYYDDHPNEDSKTFKSLIQKERIGLAHHVTLIHSTELKKNPSNKELKEIWKQCEKLCKDSPPVKVHIDKIVFNPQIMALVVNRIDPTIRTTSKIIHITVGTVDSDVKPFQSNAMCESALLGEEKPSEISVINLEQELVINGTIQAYYSSK